MPKLSKNITLFLMFFLIVKSDFGLTESLYEETNYQSLVADKKAFRVGDSLTVLVVEAARAESRAGTGSEMGTSINASASDNISNHNAALGINGSSGGDAVTSRHGFISAQLAVSVMSIKPNGMFSVQGEQTIVINGEEQKIMISGSVRQEDISRENTILSNRLTNAKIEFSGDGVVGEAQDTGIFYKVLQWLGIM